MLLLDGEQERGFPIIVLRVDGGPEPQDRLARFQVAVEGSDVQRLGALRGLGAQPRRLLLVQFPNPGSGATRADAMEERWKFLGGPKRDHHASCMRTEWTDG